MNNLWNGIHALRRYANERQRTTLRNTLNKCENDGNKRLCFLLPFARFTINIGSVCRGERTGEAGRMYLMVARRNEGEHEHRGKRGIAAESQPPVVFMAQHRSFAENRSYSLCVCVFLWARSTFTIMKIYIKFGVTICLIRVRYSVQKKKSESEWNLIFWLHKHDIVWARAKFT